LIELVSLLEERKIEKEKKSSDAKTWTSVKLKAALELCDATIREWSKGRVSQTFHSLMAQHCAKSKVNLKSKLCF
jgi:hypothetical protein